MTELRDDYCIDGFLFQTEEEAEQAQKEVEGIHYIKANLNMEDPQAVLQVYDNLIKQRLFETPVGYCFLHELKEYLVAIPAISNEDIKAIPIVQTEQADLSEIKKSKKKSEKKAEKKQKQSRQKTQKKEKNVNYKSRCTVFMTTTLILAISVITMMILAATSDNVNILNYENKLIDKYSAWEQELDEREQALDELEYQ